jgi:hypothetical protein
MRDHDQTNPPSQRQALPGRRPFSQNTPGQGKAKGPGITKPQLLTQKAVTAKRKTSKTSAHKQPKPPANNRTNTLNIKQWRKLPRHPIHTLNFYVTRKAQRQLIKQLWIFI